jgi:hypothetical protein
MELKDCKICPNHLENTADQVLCDFWREIEYKVTYIDAKGTHVIACPKENSATNKSLQRLLKAI